MDLALNNIQRLIFHKKPTNQPTNQPDKITTVKTPRYHKVIVSINDTNVRNSVMILIPNSTPTIFMNVD